MQNEERSSYVDVTTEDLKKSENDEKQSESDEKSFSAKNDASTGGNSSRGKEKVKILLFYICLKLDIYMQGYYRFKKISTSNFPK